MHKSEVKLLRVMVLQKSTNYFTYYMLKKASKTMMFSRSATVKYTS